MEDSSKEDKKVAIDQIQNDIALKILIVEDNTIAAKISTGILKNLGCNVSIAENGTKAIELYKSNQYDLIFMDLGLPDIDGIEVTKKIRKLESSSNHHTPIVALTAHASPENKKHCLAIGMNEFLSKPLNHDKATKMLQLFC